MRGLLAPLAPAQERGAARYVAPFSVAEGRGETAFGQNRRDELHGYHSTVHNRLVAGVPTAIRIRFDHVSLEGGGAALVELVLDPADGKDVNVQFRDVAVGH